MIETARFDLPAFVPAETASCGQCLARLSQVLRAVEGVAGVHLSRRGTAAIVHFDPEVTPLSTIREAVAREGAQLSSAYEHRILPIEGMDCADCALTLERGVGRLSGVEHVSINFAGARMEVEYATAETDIQAISTRVASLGYRVGTSSTFADDEGFISRILTRRANRLTLVGALSILVGGLAALAGAADWISTVLYGIAILVGGPPIARRGLVSLWVTRQLDINVLMTLAVIGAVAIGEWFEGAMVVVLFALGESLEGYTVERARQSIRSLMGLEPKEAVIRSHEGDRVVAVSQLVPGDVVVVRPGARMPVDGSVVSGASSVNQAPVTGESLPVDKRAGDDVFAGSLNGEGVLEVRASRAATDSTIARIIRMVEVAQAQKAPTQRFVDRFAAYYTPVVVAFAGLVALLPPLVAGADASAWFYRALVLLVIACPCALVISTPVSIVSALSAAARAGVLIKGGAHLEAVGSLRALAFDKTGTLTSGTPEVTMIAPADGVAEDDLLRVAALGERYSAHPIGEAIVREAMRRGLDVDDARISNVRDFPGGGVEALIDGVPVWAGSPRFVLDKVPAAGLDERAALIDGSTLTIVLVAQGDHVIGTIGLSDRVRPGASEALSDLKSAGIRQIVMLTGDRRETAVAVAGAAGIDDVEAGLLPEQKLHAIDRLLAQHRFVGMVGDGINDAPALARSTVGIAMGTAGSDAALETADVALMSDDLGKVAHTIRLAKAAKRIIVQNVALSLGIKIVFLALAVGGTATLWQAIFADVGASMLVILNGMRLLRHHS